MRINLTSVYVDDQRAALAFYTDVLGFVVRHDMPLGDAFWLTVVSPDVPDGSTVFPSIGNQVQRGRYSPVSACPAPV